MPAHLAFQPPAIAVSAPVPVCGTGLSLRFLPGGDASANARTLALHNIGGAACRISAYPLLVFRDGGGNALAIKRMTGFTQHYGGLGFGHGPVVPEIVIPAGRTATIPVSWTETGSVCFDVGSLTLDEGWPKPVDAVDRTGLRLQARLCGTTTDYLDFHQGLLTLQP